MRTRSMLRALVGSTAPGLLLALALTAAPVRASLLVPLSTDDMVARAERVVVGTVEGQSSHWASADHNVIVTDVRVRVSRGLRGVKDGEVITVRHLGGTVDEIGMRVYGEAAYTTGEEVLLFMEKRGEAFFAVGMTQGKLHITAEPGGKTVRTDLQGAELLKTAGPKQQQRNTPRPLAEVLAEVTGLLGRIPPRGARR